jgi:hypothetical protein
MSGWYVTNDKCFIIQTFFVCNYFQKLLVLLNKKVKNHVYEDLVDLHMYWYVFVDVSCP